MISIVEDHEWWVIRLKEIEVYRDTNLHILRLTMKTHGKNGPDARCDMTIGVSNLRLWGLSERWILSIILSGLAETKLYSMIVY